VRDSDQGIPKIGRVGQTFAKVACKAPRSDGFQNLQVELGPEET